MARLSNPALISTLCCLTALLSLAFACFLLPYVCPLDGDDDAGLTSVWPVLVRTDVAATLMHNDDYCRRVHPSTTAGVVVGAVPTLVSAGSESQHHQLVTMIIIVLADLAADQRKKKKSGSMAPLLIVLLLIAVAAATGCAAADARGPRCSNDPNLPRRIRACGPPSIKPHN
uniref:Uncharacterized protein n=1 Tax=Oryza nivara TaxID=4536 RepID=A0A0E0IIG1_ORYNI